MVVEYDDGRRERLWFAPQSDIWMSRKDVEKQIDDTVGSLNAKIATLERDLAAATLERDAAKRLAAFAQEAAALSAEASKSREASPAMLRVVDAVLKHRATHWSLYVHKDYDSPEWRELAAAANALAAPAVEKPRSRWTTQRWHWGNEDKWGVTLSGVWHGPFAPDVCHKLADILNAEAAR